MYGSGHSAGALMAWSWGVSRLIDALEKTPAANIDTTRLGVTGCSRNGKGALAAGAFDERIKLTIPQEPGSGGSGTWRVSNWMLSQGQNTQTLGQIVSEYPMRSCTPSAVQMVRAAFALLHELCGPSHRMLFSMTYNARGATSPSTE